MRTAPLHLACLALLLGIAAPTYADNYESFTEPHRNLALAPAEPGLLVELNVREGEVVQAGQSLAALDRETLLIAREIAETTLKSEGKSRAAQAECTLRRERLDKLRKLRAQGHAGADEVARAEADLEIAEGQRLTLEEQRALDRLELRKIEALIERRIVRSPIAGVVTRLHHEQGEFVTPAAPTVATVAELHPLRLTFHLPAAAAGKLRVGDQLDITFPDDSTPGTTQARVETILPVVDADSGTVRVKLLLDNREHLRQAGLRCRLLLDAGSPSKENTTPSVGKADLTLGLPQ